MLVKNDIRLFGTGNIGSFVKNQCLFNAAFPQFQSTVRHLEISVDLVIFANKKGLVLQKNLFGFGNVPVPGFELNIDMHGGKVGRIS
jgi:hypothetical protein